MKRFGNMIGKNCNTCQYSLTGIVPGRSTLVGHDQVREVNLNSRQGNVGMAVLSTVGTKENVWTVIGINIGGNSVLGTVVRASVPDGKIVGVHGDVASVVFEAFQETRRRVLDALLLAGFSSKVDEFEGVGTSGIRKWWRVVGASVFLTRVVDANQLKKLVGKNAAGIGLEIEPFGDVASFALLVGPEQL